MVADACDLECGDRCERVRPELLDDGRLAPSQRFGNILARCKVLVKAAHHRRGRRIADRPQGGDDGPCASEQKCSRDVEHTLLAQCWTDCGIARRKDDHAGVQSELTDLPRLKKSIVSCRRIVQKYECGAFWVFRIGKRVHGEVKDVEVSSRCAFDAVSVA